MKRIFCLAFFVAACGPSGAGSAPPDAGLNNPLSPPAAAAPPDALACESPPMAGIDVQLAPPFDAYYRAFALGTVPGVPSPLGGAVIKRGDANTLLIAGSS